MRKNYLIQIAPLVRLPVLRTQVFSYLFERALPVGTLVSIPFHQRVIQGIVVSSDSKDFLGMGKIKLRRINSVIEEELLPHWQIKLAKELARHYLSPVGIFLKLMVPGRTRIKNREPKGKNVLGKKKLSKSKEVKMFLDSENKKILVIGPASKRLDLNLSLVSQAVAAQKQCLILLPEVYYSYEMQKKFQDYFPDEEIALVHGKISKSQFLNWWKKVRHGKIRIVVATKRGVFLPFANLGMIIIEEEQDISHKQWEMSPRYSAVRAAEILGKQQGAKIIFESSSPSVETFWLAKKEKWQIVKVKESIHRKKGNKRVEIIDLGKERKSPDFPISPKLYNEISQALSKKKKVLLIAKRRGYSTFSVCQNCKNILKCSQCDRPVVYFEDSQSYRCLHCSFHSDFFSFCPDCGNFRFSHFGIGTQLIEKKIKRLFPSAKVIRLDVDNVRTAKKYKEFSQKMKSGQVDIVIGTQIALKLGGFFNFGLVSIVSVYDFLGIPDFNSKEQVLTGLVQAKKLTGAEGRLVIQTFSIKENIFDYVERNNYEKFFKEEIKLRKRFSYPPFSKLVKLSCRDKLKEQVDKKAKEIFDLLTAIGNNEIKVSEPYDPLGKKKGGYFYKNILLKIIPREGIGNPSLHSIIGGLKEGWTVDIEPVSTI